MFETLVVALAAGQLPDLVDIGGQYLPGAVVAEQAPLEAQVSSYDLAVNVPIPLSDRTFLIPGLTYHVDAVSFARAPPDFVDLRAFHAPELSLLLVQLLPRDWALSLRIAGGLAGDLRGIDAGVLRASAVALATQTFTERFVLGGGALVSYGFGSRLVLPALYVDWRPLDDLQLEAFVPAFADLRYTLFERVELGLHVEIAGNEYAVRDPRIRETFPCVGEADDPSTEVDETRARPEACFDHLAYSVGTAGLTVAVRLFSSVWLRLLGGYSFFRRFDQYDARHELLPGGRESLPGVFMTRANLTWRIPRS